MKVSDEELYETLEIINEDWDELTRVIRQKDHRVPHILMSSALNTIVTSIRIRETLNQDQIGIINQVESFVISWETMIKKPALRETELLIFCSILSFSEVSQSLKDRVFFLLKKFKFRSKAYGILLNQNETMSKSKNPYLKYYENVLLDVTEESILDLLDNWYKFSEGLVWHGTHRENNSFAFKGYWCIEAVALYKKLGSQSDKIEGHKFFPKGMLSFS